MKYLIKSISHDTAEISVDLVTARQFLAMVVASKNGLITILSGMEVRS